MLYTHSQCYVLYPTIGGSVGMLVINDDANAENGVFTLCE